VPQTLVIGQTWSRLASVAAAAAADADADVEGAVCWLGRMSMPCVMLVRKSDLSPVS
jgi:hypothetical protein